VSISFEEIWAKVLDDKHFIGFWVVVAGLLQVNSLLQVPKIGDVK